MCAAAGSASAACSVLTADAPTTASAAGCRHVTGEKLGRHAGTAAVTAVATVTPWSAFTAVAPGTPGGNRITLLLKPGVGELGARFPSRATVPAGPVGTGALTAVAPTSARHQGDP